MEISMTDPMTSDNLKESKEHTPTSDKAGEELQENAHPTEDMAQKIKELEEKIHGMEAENVRLIADMHNLRNRYEEENKRQKNYANQKILEALLPILDTIDMALMLPEEQQTLPSLLQGFTMTRTQLMQTLSTFGLDKIITDGTPFDPEQHEAIHLGSDLTQDNDIVLSTMQNGYILNGRVIRTAKVSINKT